MTEDSRAEYESLRGKCQELASEHASLFARYVRRLETATAEGAQVTADLAVRQLRSLNDELATQNSILLYHIAELADAMAVERTEAEGVAGAAASSPLTSRKRGRSVGDSSNETAKAQVNRFVQKALGHANLPEYVCKGSVGPLHSLSWLHACILPVDILPLNDPDRANLEFVERAATKKDAKEAAANKTLLWLRTKGFPI